MPDTWETAHDLDPNVADNNGDFDADGYTNIEEYLNELAEWPAPQPITFTAATNNRYAEIANWDIQWQPSKYDEVRIYSGGTATVDSVGQHAGTVVIRSGVNDATLNITGGWLKVEDAGTGSSTGTVSISAATGSAATLNLSGGLLRAEMLDKNSSGSFNFTGGVLSADEVNFDLVNDGGTLAPGESVGATLIDGDYDQSAGSTLEIEIAGLADFDTVAVTGEADLAGLVNVILDPGFVLGAGDSFEILTSGALVDSGLALATGGDNDLFTLDVDTGTGTVTLVSAVVPLVGDYNDDGIVDAADYTVWRDTLGSTTDLRANGDDTGASAGIIDEADYVAWKTNFGATSGAGSSGVIGGSVPEPASGTLAIAGLLISLSLGRKKR